jgi:hypothetical protein
MILPGEIVHLPFEDGPHRLAMGLVSAPEAALIELDDRYPAEMAERRRLLDTRHAEVFSALPGTEAASAAVLARLAEVLPARYPMAFARAGGVLLNRVTGERWDPDDPALHPLEVAGRLVQEDLCLVDVSGAAPVLAAAVLCFPSRWRLADKIGRPLTAVHGPVPGYAERLARPMDRFFAHLRPGRLATRLNWGVLDDPALFQPGGHGRAAHNPRVTAENAGSALFLRVERQTLSRAADHVLFTIRVHVTPLDVAVARPADAARLAAAVRALPEDMALYKSIPPVRAALLAWLDARGAKVSP